eukprot:749572-Amphidinium_carterae.1
MPTSSLMFLSNTLLDYMQRLRLKEDDPVERLCMKIGHWDEAAQKIETTEDHLHNFMMNTRFLFQDKVFTICSQSVCPMPPRLCAKSSEVPCRPPKAGKHLGTHSSSGLARTKVQLSHNRQNLQCWLSLSCSLEVASMVLFRYAEQTKHKAKHFDLMQILTEIDRLEPQVKTMANLKVG